MDATMSHEGIEVLLHPAMMMIALLFVLVHESDSEAASDRKSAFEKEIKNKYEDISIVKTVNWDVLRARKRG